MIYDFCVIGSGIIGAATAMKLVTEYPGSSTLVLEREPAAARHQTSHNSGVIHAGVYYAPNSLKARLCRAGNQATTRFCAEYAVPFRTTGKLLVATDQDELTRMHALFERAKANQIDAALVGADELRELEPHVSGLGAIAVTSTGIVDYAQVTAKMTATAAAQGAEFEYGAEVTGIRETPSVVEINTSGRTWRARRLVVCAGIQADRLARLSGLDVDFRMLPFRGEYYRLRPELNEIVHRPIYPIPDPSLPFLGVHVTPMIDGSVTVGPNAVLALARDRYRKGAVSGRDVIDSVRFGGTWRLARKYWRVGVQEYKNSLWKRGYAALCRRYCPTLSAADFLPHEAGIRAQAVLPDGSLVDDFYFAETARMLHVCNAPSPAATSAIPISSMIVERLLPGGRRGRPPQ